MILNKQNRFVSNLHFKNRSTVSTKAKGANYKSNLF